MISSVRNISAFLNRHPVGLGIDNLPLYPLTRVSKTLSQYRLLELAALDLQSKCGQGASLQQIVETVCTHTVFSSSQKQAEILKLLNILKTMAPRYVCEIGSYLGGTLFLLSRVAAPAALIISVDLGLSRERCWAHSRLASGGQRIVSIRGSSRSLSTIRRVQSQLRGDKLDVLLIDGDHSYDGVRADFLNYKGLVRQGGLIVIHDIVPDFRTRFGITTSSDTGEVPKFWSEIKRDYSTAEIIHDTEQDGFGIGIVYA